MEGTALLARVMLALAGLACIPGAAGLEAEALRKGASEAMDAGEPTSIRYAGKTGASALLAKLPLDFVPNRGQWDPAVRFAARKGDMAAAFGERDITLRLGKAGATSR